MTSPSAFLYRYTPGSAGIVRIFASKSIGGSRRIRPLFEGIYPFYWMEACLVVLQKGQMTSRRAVLAAPVPCLFLALLTALPTLCGLTAAQTASPQSAPSQSQSQPQVTKSPEGKSEEAARAAARAKARHFDRVLIIVLENADYERALQDPNLTALAARGASFTNFHALFHPSYPNYLAMIAGTDFGVHRGGSFLGDKQVNFPDDAQHKTIGDRLIAAGLDFKQYAEELPPGTCP